MPVTNISEADKILKKMLRKEKYSIFVHKNMYIIFRLSFIYYTFA
jgi:hypothetical protein